MVWTAVSLAGYLSYGFVQQEVDLFNADARKWVEFFGQGTAIEIRENDEENIFDRERAKEKILQFENAIREAPTPLAVLLTGHGFDGGFQMGTKEFDGKKLASMLREKEGPVLLVYDACYEHSFFKDYFSDVPNVTLIASKMECFSAGARLDEYLTVTNGRKQIKVEASPLCNLVMHCIANPLDGNDDWDRLKDYWKNLCWDCKLLQESVDFDIPTELHIRPGNIPLPSPPDGNDSHAEIKETVEKLLSHELVVLPDPFA